MLGSLDKSIGAGPLGTEADQAWFFGWVNQDEEEAFVWLLCVVYVMLQLIQEIISLSPATLLPSQYYKDSLTCYKRSIVKRASRLFHPYSIVILEI